MHRSLTLPGGLLAAALLAVPVPAQQEAPLRDPVGTALAAWQQEHGPAWILRVDSRTAAGRYLFGGAAPSPWSARSDEEFVELALDWVDAVHGMFRVDPQVLADPVVRRIHLAHIGSSDKVAVQFRQVVAGVPVVRGSVTILFDTASRLLAVDSTGLPDLADLPVAPVTGPFEAVAAAHAEYQRLEGRLATFLADPELVILPHGAGRFLEPRLAWAVELRTPVQDGVPSGRGIYVAADDGSNAVLASDQLVHHQDVIGHVDAWATPGTLPDISGNPETLQAMRFLEVTSAVGNTTTDTSGDFVIANAGPNPVDVTFRFRGPWVRVENQAGSNYTLTQSFTPGVPGSATMNPGQTELITAQANAFDAVVDMREWTKAIDPTDTTFDFQVLAKVNINATCNAFYNGSSINFYRSGGGCVNTAYSTVVAHEEGHWGNDLYGSGNGADGFGEGNADVFAMYLYDTPIVGDGFFGGTSFIRSGNNTRQFCGDANPGCYGEVHADGEVLMGALWKVRRNLNNTLGNSTGDLVADTLFFAWMNTYNDGTIQTIVEDHWLTLDDDDGNILNGTPNFDDIDGGFREQGFPGVDLQFIQIVHSPLPDTTNENGPYTVDAQITSLIGASITGAQVVYQVNSGTPVTVPMVNTGGSTWSADIPGQQSPAFVLYHIEADDGQGNHEREPRNGEWRFIVGVVKQIYFNDFEGLTDEGWTHTLVATQDDWQRGAPQGKSGSSFGVSWSDPSSAWSGSKVWANDLGNTGWNGAYAARTHNYLESPALDLSGEFGVFLRFARWLTVEQGIYDDALIKVNGNIAWRNPATSHVLDTAWSVQELDISPWADNNPSVVLRWELQSDGGLELGGWNIDDVELFSVAPVGTTDTILLSGPATANVGDMLAFSYTNAPGGAATWLAYSLNLNGSTVAGHSFDLGAPYTVAATGNADPTGVGSWSVGPVPGAASGRTIHFEVAAQTGPDLFDSNVVSVTIP